MNFIVRFTCILMFFFHFIKIFASNESPRTDRSHDRPGVDRPPLEQAYTCDADPKMTVKDLSLCPNIMCWDGVTEAKVYRHCPVNTGNTSYSQVCKKVSYNHLCIEYYAQTDIDNLSATVNFNLFMADLMKDYKQLSANFLENNDSISSIPKNLASLQSRHIKWISHVEKILIQNKIDFESITDSTSYRTVVGKINTIAANLFPNDSGLSITEMQFTSDVMRVRDELSTIKTRLDGLLNDPLIDKMISFTGDNATILSKNLITLSNNIATTMKGLNDIRLSISNQQLVRQKMKNYTVALWMATADKALDIHNINEANDLIIQMKRSLTSPFIFSQMLTDLNRLNIKTEEYFSTYYTPFLARRSVFAYWQNSLDYQDKVVNSEDIDPLYKQQMQFKLDTVINLIPSFIARSTKAIEKSNQYLDQRKKNIQIQIKLLDRENKKLTSQCQVLADTILNDTLATSTIPSETNYIEFRQNCWKGVEK